MGGRERNVGRTGQEQNKDRNSRISISSIVSPLHPQASPSRRDCTLSPTSPQVLSPQLPVLQLLSFKESGLGLSWQHKDF